MFRIIKVPSSGSDNLYFDWNYSHDKRLWTVTSNFSQSTG